MALQDTDISWQVLRQIVHEWAGTAAELQEVKPLEGGCINNTLAITTNDGAKAVLKISPHRVNRDHQREAYQLNLLRDVGIPVPQVLHWSSGSLDNPNSYLLMQFIEGINLAEAKKACSPEEMDSIQSHLAELVLAMHSHTRPQYMRVADGETKMFDNWPAFYHHIYDAIWHDVEKSNVLTAKCRKQIGKVHEKLDRLLGNGDQPRLVHWDVWATNIMVHPNENGQWRVVALLDPNCKYAHSEAEIAYMELFHTITPAFMKTYQQNGHMHNDYHRIRKHIYQLYPLINHVHLFGQGYVAPLQETLDRVSNVV